MSWFGTLLSAGKVAVKGLNWQLLLLKVALVVGILGATYGLGVYNTKVNYAEAAAERAEVRGNKIAKAVVERAPVVVAGEVKAAKQNERVVYIKEKLNEQAAKAPVRPECKLTADELQLYREVAELTGVR